MILWGAVVVALAAALASAVLLASRDREHWPVAACLAAGLVIDLVVGHKQAWGIAAQLDGVPRTGGALVLYHVANALVSLWPAALAWCAWAVFVRTSSGRVRTLGPILAVWLAFNAALVTSWPHTPETAQRALLAAEVAALVAGAVAVGRGLGAWTWSRIAVLWLLGIEAVVVTVGPYRTSVYERWDLARVAYLLCFAALAVGQVVAWRRR